MPAEERFLILGETRIPIKEISTISVTWQEDMVTKSMDITSGNFKLDIKIAVEQEDVKGN